MLIYVKQLNFNINIFQHFKIFREKYKNQHLSTFSIITTTIYIIFQQFIVIQLAIISNFILFYLNNQHFWSFCLSTIVDNSVNIKIISIYNKEKNCTLNGTFMNAPPSNYWCFIEKTLLKIGC